MLAELNLKPDFEFPAASGAQLTYIHRCDGKADIYFVSNQRGRFDAADSLSRVSGKLPELWNPETGRMGSPRLARGSGGRLCRSLSSRRGRCLSCSVHRQGVTTWSPSNVRGPALSVPEPKRTKLRIIKAVYGPAENAADVTTKVKSLVAGGAKGIRAGNELAEDDPAPGVVKRLRVEFVLNGDTKSAGTREGQTLELPAGAEVTKALYGELRTRDNLALPERGPDAEAGRSESRATNWRSG